MPLGAFEALQQRAATALERARKSAELLEGLVVPDPLSIALTQACRAAALAVAAGEKAVAGAAELASKVPPDAETDAYITAAAAADASTNAAEAVERLVDALLRRTSPREPH